MSMRRRRILAAALASPLLPSPALARVPLAAEPIDRMTTPWWRERHEAKLAEIRRSAPNLLMLGDSITQDYEERGPPGWRDFVPVWEHFYGGRRAINLGFKGDATSHLLWRLLHGELEGMRPRAAVLLIGANNMGAPHWGAADTIEGIEAILRLCRQKQPQMGVALVDHRHDEGDQRGAGGALWRRQSAGDRLRRRDGAVRARRRGGFEAVHGSDADPAGATAAPDGADPGADGGDDRAGAGGDAGRRATGVMEAGAPSYPAGSADSMGCQARSSR
jgi:hypothetical protein